MKTHPTSQDIPISFYHVGFSRTCICSLLFRCILNHTFENYSTLDSLTMLIYGFGQPSLPLFPFLTSGSWFPVQLFTALWTFTSNFLDLLSLLTSGSAIYGIWNITFTSGPWTLDWHIFDIFIRSPVPAVKRIFWRMWMPLTSLHQLLEMGALQWVPLASFTLIPGQKLVWFYTTVILLHRTSC